MGFVIWILNSYMENMWFMWKIILLIPLGGLIYVGMMIKLNAITPEMKAILKKQS